MCKLIKNLKQAIFFNQLGDFIIQETMTWRSKGIIYNQQMKEDRRRLSGGVSAETGAHSTHTFPLWSVCPEKHTHS